MLPPIYKSTNGLPNDRRGSVGDGSRKQVAVPSNFPAPHRTDSQPNNNVSDSAADRMTERVNALERENEHSRQEIQHLRQLYSNNQLHHENEKLSVSNIAEDLQRLANAFNKKLQADTSHHQREQQKAALLFAEVSRLGHRVEEVESELRAVVGDINRKLEAQEQHAQFIASLTSKQQPQQVGSPTRNTEFQRQLRDIQDAMLQLRSDLDSDRDARWKSDAAVDAKLEAQLARLNVKLAADKRDLARVLDEQRQLVSGADFQRVTAHMREFSRVNDHLIAMERWLHGEFGQVKRLFQAVAGDVDARFQSVLMEIANGVKVWHAAQTRQEDEMELRIRELEEAIRAVAHTIQRKLQALEEVVPLEVQARQKNDDKLKKRVESVVKSLSRAIERGHEGVLPFQTALLQRVDQLELDQQNAFGQVELQHNAMRAALEAFSQEEVVLPQTAIIQRVDQLELDQQSLVSQVEMQHNAMREALETFSREGVILPQTALQHRVEQLELDQQDALGQAEVQHNAMREALEAFSREEVLLPQSALLRRVGQLELEHQNVLGQVEVQHNAMRGTIETFMKDSDAMLAKLADTIEQERSKGMQQVMIPVVAPTIAPVAAPTVLSTEATSELRAETRRVKQELDALQGWSAQHAQECRQFLDFLNWSMEDSRRESGVVQCLNAVIDQIVERQALEQLCALDRSVSGALRKMEKAKAAIPGPAPTQTERTEVVDKGTDIDTAGLADLGVEIEEDPLADEDKVFDAAGIQEDLADEQGDGDDHATSMDTTQYSIDFEQPASSPVRQERLPDNGPIPEEDAPDQEDPSLLDL